MTIRSTFHILVLLVVLLIFSSRSVFGRGQRPTEREVETKQSAVLLIGDHEGIDETDAQNAALLVNEALRKRGIIVIDPVQEALAGATIYRVVLRRSDEKILFRLSEEDSVGTLLVERELLLADIEEIASAASRLVSALVRRKPISRDPILFNGDVFTAIVPVKELDPGLGVGISLSIDRLSYAVDIGFQIAWMETGFRHTSDSSTFWSKEEKDSLNFWSAAIGGRYFFNKQNLSPYVGGGLAAMSAKYTTTVRNQFSGFAKLGGGNGLDWDFVYDEYPEEDSGIGAYGILGIELRHYSRYRLKLELRVNRPFFKLPSQDVMPITLGIAGGFSF